MRYILIDNNNESIVWESEEVEGFSLEEVSLHETKVGRFKNEDDTSEYRTMMTVSCIYKKTIKIEKSIFKSSNGTDNIR